MDNLIIVPPKSWVDFFNPADRANLPMRMIEFYRIATELFTSYYRSNPPSNCESSNLHNQLFFDVEFDAKGSIVVSGLMADIFREFPNNYFQSLEYIDEMWFSALGVLIEEEGDWLGDESKEKLIRWKKVKVLISALITEIFKHCQGFTDPRLAVAETAENSVSGI